MIVKILSVINEQVRESEKNIKEIENDIRELVEIKRFITSELGEFRGRTESLELFHKVITSYISNDKEAVITLLKPLGIDPIDKTGRLGSLNGIVHDFNTIRNLRGDKL